MTSNFAVVLVICCSWILLVISITMCYAATFGLKPMFCEVSQQLVCLVIT